MDTRTFGMAWTRRRVVFFGSGRFRTCDGQPGATRDSRDGAVARPGDAGKRRVSVDW